MKKDKLTLASDIRDEDCYNSLEVYKNDILPHIMAIKDICKINRIPMFISVAVANDKAGTTYENECELAYTQRRLTDNRIVKMLRALNGFKYELPADILSAVYTVLNFCDSVEPSKGSTLGELRLTEDMFDKITRICNGASDVLPEKQYDDLSDDENLIIPKIYEEDDDGLN